MNIIEYSKKPKQNKCIYPEVENIIKIFRNTLFTYTPPEGLDKMQVENALSSGIAALYKCPVKGSVNYNNWCCTPAYPATKLSNNLTFSKCTTFGTDYGVELDVGSECILLYNNSMKSPDDLIKKYSEIIGEIDKTLMSITKWSRLMPIPKVHDNADVAKYTGVMQSILDGNLLNVISEKNNLLSVEGQEQKDMLQLTDVNASEKLHFLSEYRQDVIKRISSLYGIPIQMSTKNAQILSDELHGMDIYSTYVLLDRYYTRKESFDRAEIFTGVKWNFDFSEITKHTVQDIFSHGGDSDDDNISESSTKDTDD